MSEDYKYTEEEMMEQTKEILNSVKGFAICSALFISAIIGCLACI